MNRVPSAVLNKIAKFRMRSAEMRALFQMSEEEKAKHLEEEYQFLTKTAAVGGLAALAYLELGPLLAENEAISRYIVRSGRLDLRSCLPEITSVQEALVYARTEWPLLEGEALRQLSNLLAESVEPRSAAETRKSAIKNVEMSFDEDTYAAAKPYFRAGLAHFRQRGADIVEMMGALIVALRDQFGMEEDTIAAMKPYVLRYISDVQAGREAIEEANPQQPTEEKLQQQRDGQTMSLKSSRHIGPSRRQ